MSFRFRIGPFTFGSSGIRLSLWSRGSGISIPLTNRKKAKSFGKVKVGPLSYYATEKTKTQIPEKINDPKIQNIKKMHSQAYEPWTAESDANLISLFRQGKTVKELSVIFGRTAGAIRSRIDKLLLR